MFRSVKNFFLVFLKCSETWFFLFSPFRAALKHQKSLLRLSAPRLSTKKIPFRPYVVVRSTNFLFFMLMSLSEAFIFSIPCLCHCQKHQFSFFYAYVVVRSTNFLFFMLMSLSEAPIFFFSCLCR